MDLGLKGRIAIVAAASTGLGRAVAEELAKEGCELAICSSNPAKIEKAANEISKLTGREVFWRAVDVSKPADVTAFSSSLWVIEPSLLLSIWLNRVCWRIA